MSTEEEIKNMRHHDEIRFAIDRYIEAVCALCPHFKETVRISTIFFVRLMTLCEVEPKAIVMASLLFARFFEARQDTFSLCAIFRCSFTCIMISNKLLEDVPYANTIWADMAQKCCVETLTEEDERQQLCSCWSLEMVNMMEFEFLGTIGCQLAIEDVECPYVDCIVSEWDDRFTDWQRQQQQRGIKTE